jgi:hypothetical protein
MSVIENSTKIATRSVAEKIPNRSVRISGHSDLFYWWIVWAYAAICSGLTYFHGDLIRIGQKAVHVHPNPAMGISFTILLLFVTIFTHARARGVYAVVFLLGIAVVTGAIQAFVGWDWIFSHFTVLSVHMNMAFYAMIAIVLVAVWLFVVFVAGRFDYLDVQQGRIEVKNWNLITGINPIGVTITDMAGDPFMHWFLGLRWLGFGTGDIEISYPGANNVRDKHVIKNVWRAAKKAERARKIIAEHA